MNERKRRKEWKKNRNKNENDNKNTKSKGIQDMFELSNLDVDVEEIIRLATCNLK